MSIPFFKSIMKMLGKRVRYDSISNLYGNAFAKDADKVVQESMPLKGEKKANASFGWGASPSETVKHQASAKDLANISWALD